MHGPARSAAAAVTAMLVATLAAACTGDSPSSSSSSSSSGTSSGTSHAAGLELTRLPPIAQTGATPADADAATPVLVASVRPARAGVRVTLQRKASSGWSAVASSPTDGYGLADFTLPGSREEGVSAGYRAVTASPKRTTSGTVSDPWRMSFSDGFSGRSLGKKWTYRQLGLESRTSGRRVSASSKAAVQVRDGALRLQVKKNPNRPGHYLNGHVSTEATYSFQYGVAAARIKFQRPRGAHGAFWSQSPTVNSYPGDPKRSGTEIDIGEYFGDGYPRGGLASYVYHYDKSGKNIKDGNVLPRAVGVVGSADAFWKKFHVYSVQWSPQGYVFRIDGRVTFLTDEAVSGRPQYLVLSLLSSDWELPDLDERLLPGTMKVDWVRVWQQ
jgi:beta-glucanase (GH16 family)